MQTQGFYLLILSGQLQGQPGLFDLRQVDLTNVTDLRGEWQFHWRQLLTPSQLANKSLKKSTLMVPRVWNDSSDQGIKSQGYATYRTVLLVKPEPAEYVLRLLEVPSAAKVWVNGIPAIEQGQVGLTRLDSVPGHGTKYFTFKGPRFDCCFHRTRLLYRHTYWFEFCSRTSNRR